MNNVPTIYSNLISVKQTIIIKLHKLGKRLSITLIKTANLCVFQGVEHERDQQNISLDVVLQLFQLFGIVLKSNSMYVITSLFSLEKSQQFFCPLVCIRLVVSNSIRLKSINCTLADIFLINVSRINFRSSFCERRFVGTQRHPKPIFHFVILTLSPNKGLISYIRILSLDICKDM